MKTSSMIAIYILVVGVIIAALCFISYNAVTFKPMKNAESRGPLVATIKEKIVPLSAGSYTVKGIAAFTAENIDRHENEGFVTEVDFSLLSKGLVHISVEPAMENQVFVTIVPTYIFTDDAEGFYDNRLKPYGSAGAYALTYGSVEYELSVWVKRSPVDEVRNRYERIYNKVFTAEFDEIEPYKYSNVFSEFKEDSVIHSYAHALTHELNHDMEKAKAIIAFVNDHLTYDETAPTEYTVMKSADEIFESEAGVCHNYTTLCSAMLKSVGIPVREIRGFNKITEVFHSWCEIYIDGEWLTADPTWYRTFPANPENYIPEEFSNPHN